MFQVRQVQPLFAAVLCRLEDIPQDIMIQIVDDTPWANDFYNVSNTNYLFIVIFKRCYLKI